MKQYDPNNKRITETREKANSAFWDNHWQTDNITEKIESGKNNILVNNFTRKLLPVGSIILEGGCGIGQNVYGLRYHGFDVYGVDFAQDTIRKTKEHFPDLQISYQDVKQLNFQDSYFDGYWSIGLIEHFWEGYEEILIEAKRVIKQNGYFFLTFPYLSPLRKLKIFCGTYATRDDDQNNENFYQFILDATKVKADVEKHGFKLELSHPFDPTKGLKDEIPLLKLILQKIYNSQTITSRGLRYLISLVFSRVAAHNILLVFKKL